MEKYNFNFFDKDFSKNVFYAIQLQINNLFTKDTIESKIITLSIL